MIADWYSVEDASTIQLELMTTTWWWRVLRSVPLVVAERRKTSHSAMDRMLRRALGMTGR